MTPARDRPRYQILDFIIVLVTPPPVALGKIGVMKISCTFSLQVREIPTFAKSGSHYSIPNHPNDIFPAVHHFNLLITTL